MRGARESVNVRIEWRGNKGKGGRAFIRGKALGFEKSEERRVSMMDDMAVWGEERNDGSGGKVVDVASTGAIVETTDRIIVDASKTSREDKLEGQFKS